MCVTSLPELRPRLLVHFIKDFLPGRPGILIIAGDPDLAFGRPALDVLNIKANVVGMPDQKL